MRYCIGVLYIIYPKLKKKRELKNSKEIQIENKLLIKYWIIIV